ncbi:MAG: 2-amino-4-hydroxy-6-hydroxymethyldihydropteridine diphosphokinase [Bacteroidales bacterium]|nr:2-amino-4-hydroxy-6-hydroxymethyldihydropteridine diphosphokinase [Bacteroidales bacterium]
MIYLLLGTNLGCKRLNIARAESLLKRYLKAHFVKSKVLVTKAIGFDGPAFLNRVLAFEREDSLTPEHLLDICQKVEIEMGRPAHTAKYDGSGARVYESRVIDIDILMFDDAVINTERLTIPHPQVTERPFVKELLNQLL